MERECRWEKYLSNNYTYPEEFEIVEWAYRSAGFSRVSINPRIVVAFNYRDRFRFRRPPVVRASKVERLSPFFFYFSFFPILLILSFSIYLKIYLLAENFRKDNVNIRHLTWILQLETAAEGWGDKIESQQATSGAIERRVGHFGLVAPVRAKYPQQAGQTQHPQTQRQLPSDEELFSR